MAAQKQGADETAPKPKAKQAIVTVAPGRTFGLWPNAKGPGELVEVDESAVNRLYADGFILKPE